MVTLVATPCGRAPGFPLRRLQLHQDRREPLREVVVNITCETIPLLEDRFTPFFNAVVIDEAAVMKRQCCLPGDGLDEHDAAPAAVRLRRAHAAHRHPSERPVAKPQRRGDGGLPVHVGREFANLSGKRSSFG